MAAFGIWPPDGGGGGGVPAKYAIIENDGNLLFQSTPNFLVSTANTGTGLYLVTFLPGEFVIPTAAVFAQPLGAGVARSALIVIAADDLLTVETYDGDGVLQDSAFFFGLDNDVVTP